MRRWYYKWRIRVWKRRLAFHLLDVKAQEEHPIGGKYLADDVGLKARMIDLERAVTLARHKIMVSTARIDPKILEGLAEYPKARALTTGKADPDE